MDTAPVTRAELNESITFLQRQIEALSKSLQVREDNSQPSTSNAWRGPMGGLFMATSRVIGPCSEGNDTEMKVVQTDNRLGSYCFLMNISCKSKSRIESTYMKTLFDRCVKGVNLCHKAKAYLPLVLCQRRLCVV